NLVHGTQRAPLPHSFPQTTLFRSRPACTDLRTLEEELDGLSARRAGPELRLDRGVEQLGPLLEDLPHLVHVDDLVAVERARLLRDRKSTRLNSSHVKNSYAGFSLE